MVSHSTAISIGTLLFWHHFLPACWERG